MINISSDLINISSYPFPKRQILDLSKLKEFADDNFKFEENGVKFSKWLDNTVGKGEIARYEQFLLFSLCFQKTCTADTSLKHNDVQNWTYFLLCKLGTKQVGFFQKEARRGKHHNFKIV